MSALIAEPQLVHGTTRGEGTTGTSVRCSLTRWQTNYSRFSLLFRVTRRCRRRSPSASASRPRRRVLGRQGTCGARACTCGKFCRKQRLSELAGGAVRCRSSCGGGDRGRDRSRKALLGCGCARCGGTPTPQPRSRGRRPGPVTRRTRRSSEPMSPRLEPVRNQLSSRTPFGRGAVSHRCRPVRELPPKPRLLAPQQNRLPRAPRRRDPRGNQCRCVSDEGRGCEEAARREGCVRKNCGLIRP